MIGALIAAAGGLVLALGFWWVTGREMKGRSWLPGCRTTPAPPLDQSRPGPNPMPLDVAAAKVADEYGDTLRELGDR